MKLRTDSGLLPYYIVLIIYQDTRNKSGKYWRDLTQFCNLQVNNHVKSRHLFPDLLLVWRS